MADAYNAPRECIATTSSAFPVDKLTMSKVKIPLVAAISPFVNPYGVDPTSSNSYDVYRLRKICH